VRNNSDEKYVLDLVAEMLNENFEWQKRFDSLRGDVGKRKISTRLPVDAYFANSNLIVEYREIQHYKSVGIMDSRITISGVNRKEQRQIYDLRKEEWVKFNGINFIAIPYFNLAHKSRGKLKRDINFDKEAIKQLLNL